MSSEPSWLEIVRRVVKEISASDVYEFELAQPGFRLRLRRLTTSSRRVTTAAPETFSGIATVAPFTGVFYAAPSPTAEPYVREGDWVEAGTTIGLIETMKIFNEVTTEQAGRVEKIIVESGQLVQAGDPLVWLALTELTEEPRL